MLKMKYLVETGKGTKSFDGFYDAVDAYNKSPHGTRLLLEKRHDEDHGGDYQIIFIHSK